MAPAKVQPFLIVLDQFPLQCRPDHSIKLHYLHYLIKLYFAFLLTGTSFPLWLARSNDIVIALFLLQAQDKEVHELFTRM